MLVELQQKWEQKLASASDFITNIRHSQKQDSFILIHDEHRIDIVMGEDKLQKLINNPQQSQYKRTIKFQTPIYDALMIDDRILVSNCNMPVRLYKLNQQNFNSVDWVTFVDKKPNSQLFLTPIQMAVKGDVIIGGGKKFASQYDLTKLCVKRRFKQMFKRYISSVQLLDENEAVMGQFNGQLSFLDLRTQQISNTLKPHVDLVTRIKSFPTNRNQLLTVARKDNYSYLWDVRQLGSFVQCYEQPLFGNQRTGVEISRNEEIVYFGGQNGQVTGKSIENGATVCIYDSGFNSCVSSLCNGSNNSLLASLGSRTFALDEQTESQQSAGRMICLAI